VLAWGTSERPAQRIVQVFGRSAMYGTLMRIVVKAGKRSEFLEYLRWDAEVAKDHEPGTLRFDVWEVETEADVVYLYEAYRDIHAFEEHQRNEPYRKWDEVARDTVVLTTDVIPFTHSVTSNLAE
jgi:autoinducer 2-degrading protein